MSQEDESVEEERSPVDSLDQLKSYAAFGVHAIKKRLLLSLAIFGTIFSLALLALWLWPRSYRCESTLMVQDNSVLLNDSKLDPLNGASSVILRHETLLAIVKETGLAKRVLADRPPLLRLKDRITGLSQVAERDLELMALGSLEAALSVSRWENNLTIGVNWGNAEMAARLVKRVQESFLEARHVAEISTIAEKMSILDGHSAELRKEIDAIADQLKDVREDKKAEIGKAALALPAATQLQASPKPRPRAAPAAPAISEEETLRRKEELVELRAELEKKKRALDELKGDRSRRLIAAQEQRANLLDSFTPAHPEVKKVDRLVESLSGTSAPIKNLQEEITVLTERIKASAERGKPAAPRAVSASGTASDPAADPAANVLPTEILKLLESGEQIDPAVTIQLEGAVSKYASLRDAIRTARVDLDTAQAAFNHRYKIVTPAEVPAKPSKPEPRKVLGIGFLLALLFMFLIPVVAEIRSGFIVARWQVQHMELPILAELRLPPGNRD